MSKFASLLALLFPLFCYATQTDLINEVSQFLSRQGVIVEITKDRVILDLGRGKAFEGEKFTVVREGKDLVHPVTGEVIGKVEEKVGEVTVSEVRENFSYAEGETLKGIKKGDRAVLNPGRVCFKGSDEVFFRLSPKIPGLVKGQDNCTYLIKELEGGLGIEFKGKAVAFFEFEKIPPRAVGGYEKKEIKGAKLEVNLLMSIKSLPVSADLCRLSASPKKYLVLLTETRLEIYEVLGNQPVKFLDKRIPAGDPVFVQCAPVGGYDRDLIILNMLTGDNPQAYIYKLSGESLRTVAEGIEMFVGVLDRDRADETLVAQEFDSRDLWGDVKRISLSGDEVIEKESLDLPDGFRIDSALMVGDILLFVDTGGTLRVFRDNSQIFTMKGFGGSYTTAQIMGLVEDEESYIFNTRPFRLYIDGEVLPGVIKNLTSPVYRFLNVAKYSEGELYFLVFEGDEVKPVRVKSKKLEEAVQAVLTDDEGTILVITAKKGTLSIRNSGEVYEGTLKVR